MLKKSLHSLQESSMLGFDSNKWKCHSLLYSHTFGHVFSGWKIKGKKIQLDLPQVV